MTTMGRAVFDENMDALIYAGEQVEVSFGFEQQNATKAWIDQDTDGRVIALRVVADSGAVLASSTGAWVQRYDDLAREVTDLRVELTGTQTAALLPAGREAARYGGELAELADDGRIVVQEFGVLVKLSADPSVAVS